MKIKTLLIVFVIPIVIVGGTIIFLNYQKSTETMESDIKIIKLPEPEYEGKLSVEEAISQRRSVRDYQDEPLTLEDISQLLWAAQGLNKRGSRVVPSAGALYPIEIYLVVKDVKDLVPGVYHYLISKHSLEKYIEYQIDDQLEEAALDQSYVGEAPIKIIISGIFERTAIKYGDRAPQYVYQESGHVSQNIYLQAESLGLGTVTVGGFRQSEVDNLLGFSEGQQTLYIMPVGRK